MSWFYLIVAIALEVMGTVSMKFAEGFTRLGPSVLIFVFYAISFAAFTLALRGIDLGIAYAVWAALGTAAIALIGILWFAEPLTVLKSVSLVLIIAGVVGLNLGGGAS